VRALLHMQIHTAEIDGAPRPSEDDARTLLEWAEGAIVDHACLQGVLEGTMRVRIGADGEPSFSLSAAGNDRARDIIRKAGLDPDNLTEPPRV
jgi:hypothetical protein